MYFERRETSYSLLCDFRSKTGKQFYNVSDIKFGHKNTPLSALNYFSRPQGDSKSFAKKPPKSCDIKFGHKNTPLSALNYFPQPQGDSKSFAKKPPKACDVNFGHKNTPLSALNYFSQVQRNVGGGGEVV